MAERYGHVAWGPWVFDYNVSDYEGLILTDGSFRGIQTFNKLSLPVIRVKYVIDGGVFSSGCGPYNDIIRWDPYNAGDAFEDLVSPDHHLVQIKGHGYVLFQHSKNDLSLEIAVYARVGKYHLYQSYIIHSEGYIFPKLYSKGLSCNLDHRHHPYWRFDINADGVGNRVSVSGPIKNGVFKKEGGGAIPDINHHWLIENSKTGHAVFVIPGKTDTARADDFSRFDFYIRKFRYEEDKEWWRKPEQEIAFTKHEPIDDNTDIVFWYIAHLHHHASEGADHWHEVGPTLQVSLKQRDLPAHQIRRVLLVGSMRVVDYEYFDDNEISTRTMTEFRDLSPDFRYAEFYLEERMGGEIRVQFKIKLEWNVGYINVNYHALLFEGASESTGDLDGEYKGNYILKDNTWEWRSFTVANTDEDIPDMARIEFRLDNIQKP